MLLKKNKLYFVAKREEKSENSSVPNKPQYSLNIHTNFMKNIFINVVVKSANTKVSYFPCFNLNLTVSVF